MRTEDLTGEVLDYWVAKAEGRASGALSRLEWLTSGEWFCPSTTWEHGGPIIEREGIGLAHQEDGTWSGYIFDHAGGGMQNDYEAETPLVAAMRAFVASKYGVYVPDE